jgi:predicted CXXCH cytochrome family protein
MIASKVIKTGFVSVWLLFGAFYLASNSLSKASGSAKTKPEVSAPDKYKAEDYVGSEACKTCHTEQFANFSKTTHGRIAGQPNWKGKMQGCESCHGPGKLHVEGGGDKTKIRTFEGESPKQISENCLECHAGKEEHNNYKRGEHWRNDVGCTSCHSPHGEIKAASETAPAPSSEKYLSSKPGDISRVIPEKMLKLGEPQLCLQCHSEVKAQFSMPFHHRVPEGSMKCSDCHNPHGGFEQKQARLAVGADAPCIKCHTDKQGPFVFEHAPVKEEGCSICHTPHGSANPRLLKRSNTFQLCLECHSTIGTLGGAPNTPTFHNVTTTRFQNCTTCHVKIHGSNANVFFFR